MHGPMNVKFIFFCRLFKASFDSVIHDHHERHKNNTSII